MPPRHTPGDLQFFLSFLEVYSPLPGTQKETIPHLEHLTDLMYVFCYIVLIRTKAKLHVLTTFMNVFLSLLREGYSMLYG